MRKCKGYWRFKFVVDLKYWDLLPSICVYRWETWKMHTHSHTLYCISFDLLCFTAAFALGNLEAVKYDWRG